MIQPRDRGEPPLSEEERHLREFRRWGRGIKVVLASGQSLSEGVWAVLHPDEAAWRAWRRFSAQHPATLHGLDGFHHDATKALEAFRADPSEDTEHRLALSMERLSRHVFDVADALAAVIAAPAAASVSEPPPPPLSENDAAILSEMLAMNADANNPQPRESILSRLGWKSEGKRAFDKLKRHGYVKGCRLGFYLLDAGRRRAETLR